MSVPSYAVSDSVSAVLGYALDGLSLRQNTIADNLANVDTPGFRATAVDFESVLRSAIGGSALAAVQSQFMYQMVARAVSDRFDLVKTVAGAM